MIVLSKKVNGFTSHVNEACSIASDAMTGATPIHSLDPSPIFSHASSSILALVFGAKFAGDRS